MITVECPHCKMRMAITRAKAESIAREVALEEIREFCTPPLVQPHLDLKGDVPDEDRTLLESLGIKP